MFSGVVASLLTRYLSTYLKGVRAEQLDISARGEVELRDVQLREEPLSELLVATGSGLKGGRVGRVAMQLQGWGGLTVQVDRLTILLAAVAPPRPSSAQQYEADRVSAKRAQLGRSVASQSTPSAISSLIGRLGQKVLGGVEVHITELHIRYEDALSNPLAPFILGVRVGSLSVERLDTAGVAKSIAVRDVTFYGGRVRDALTGLASYASNEDMFARLDGHFHSAPAATIPSPVNPAAAAASANPLAPFIGPFDVEAQIELGSAPGTALAELRVSVTIPPLSIALQQQQLHCLVAAAWWARTAPLRMEQRRERPTTRVEGNAVAWWTYLLRTILHRLRDRRRRHSLAFIVRRRQLRGEYISLHAQRIHAQARGVSVPSQTAARLQELEDSDELSIPDILLFRSAAEALAANEPETEEKSAAKESWVKWLWKSVPHGAGSSSPSVAPAAAAPPPVPSLSSLTTDQKRYIYQAIGMSVTDAQAPAPLLTSTRVIQVKLQSVDLALLLPSRQLLSARILQCNLKSEDGPAGQRLHASVETVEVRDTWTERTHYPVILRPRTDYAAWLTLDYIAPQEWSEAPRLRVEASACDAVLNLPWVDQVAFFFASPSAEFVSPTDRVEDSKGGDDRNLIMDVAISEPHIVVPEAADADAAWLLVVTATAFKLRSAPSPPVEAFIGAHYAKHTLTISGFRASLFDPSRPSDPHPILAPLDLSLALHSLLRQAAGAPALRLFGEVPLVEGAMSAHEVGKLLAIVVRLLYFVPATKDPSAPIVARLSPLLRPPVITELSHPFGPPAAEIQLLFTRVRFALLQHDGKPFATAIADEALLQLTQSTSGRADVTMTVRRLGLDISESGTPGVYLLRNWEQGGAPVPLRVRLAFVGASRPTLRHGGSLAMIDTIDLELQTGVLYVTPQPAALEFLLHFTQLLAHHRLPELVSALAPASAITFLRAKATCAGAQLALLDEHTGAPFTTLALGELHAFVHAAEQARAQVSLASCTVEMPEHPALPPVFALSGGVALSFSSSTSPLGPPQLQPDELRLRIGLLRVALSLPFIHRAQALMRSFQPVRPAPSLHSAPIPVQLPATSAPVSAAPPVQLQIAIAGAETSLRTTDDPLTSAALLCRLGPSLLFTLSRPNKARSYHVSLADAGLSVRLSSGPKSPLAAPMPLIRGVAFTASAQQAANIPLRVRLSLAPGAELCVSAEAIEQAAQLGHSMHQVLATPPAPAAAIYTPPSSPLHSTFTSPGFTLPVVSPSPSPIPPRRSASIASTSLLLSPPPPAAAPVEFMLDVQQLAVLVSAKGGAILLSARFTGLQLRGSTVAAPRVSLSVHLAAVTVTGPYQDTLVSATSSPVLSVSLSLAPELTAAHVRLVGLRLCITPATVKALTTFGTPQLPPSTDSALPLPPSPSTSAPTTRTGVEVRVEVKDARVSLQSDLDKLSLSTGLRLSYTVPPQCMLPTRAVALIDGLCVQREVTEEETAVILSPAEMIIELEGTSEHKRVSVEAGALHIAVSPSDLAVAASLSSSLTKAIPPTPTADLAPTVPPAAQTPASVRIRCVKIAVTLITDLGGIDLPIATLRLLDVRAEGRKERTGGAEARAQLTVEGKAFRLEQGGWDSLIEAWPLAISYATPTTGAARVLLSAPRALDVNVTKALFLRLISIATQHTQPRPAPVRRPPVELLLLRNTTGVEIEYILAGVLSARNTASRLRLAPDEQRALINAQRQRRGLLSLPSLRGATISIFVPGYQPLVGLELHRVHTRLFTLSPLVPMSASEIRVRYEVHLEGACRVAELAGAASVLNSSPLPIELSSSEKSQHWSCLMQPGTRRSLPILASSSLRLRPASSRANYEWSELLNFPLQPGQRQEVLAPSLPVAAHRDPVIAVALSAENSENGLVSVELRTPLVIENLTCAELQFRLFAHDEHKCSGRVLQGAEETVLTVGEWESMEQAALSLELHLSGWEPTRLSLVPRPDGQEQRTTISMMDQYDRPLLLETSLTLGQGAAMRVSVWSKFVLLNRTRLPLLFRQFRRTAEILPVHRHKLAAGQVRDDSEDEEQLELPEDDSEQAQREREERRKRVADLHRMRREQNRDEDDVLMFAFLGTDLIEHRLQVRVAGETHWSEPFRIDQTATSIALALRQRNSSSELYLGVHVQLGQGRYRRSRVVSFEARWVFVNGLSQPLHVKQASVPQSGGAAALTVPAGATMAFHWPVPPHDAATTLPLDVGSVILALGTGGWSGAMPISSPAEFAIKLPLPPPQLSEFAHAEIMQERATWIVRLVPLPASLPPYRLENCSPFVVRVHQRDVEEEAPITLTPYESVSYAWRCPAAPHRLVMHIPALDYLRIFPPDKLKTWEVKLPSQSTSDALTPVAPAAVDLVVEAFSDGPTRVLRLLDRTRHVPMSVARHAAAPPDSVNFDVEVQLSGAGLSLIDSKEELLYFSLSEANIKLALGSITQRFDVKLGRVQIDTQVHGSRYPVALFMRSPSGSATPPTLQLSVERSWEYQDVLYLPRFRISVGASLADVSPTAGGVPAPPLPSSELELRLDEVLLVRLANFADFQLLPPPRSSRLRLSPFPRHTVSFSSLPAALRRDSLIPTAPLREPLSRRETMIYMEALELGAIRVRLTFTSSPGTDESRDANNPLRLLGALGVAGLAANVDAAPVFLDALLLQHPYCSGRELATRVGRHYAQQMLDGVYKVLGSFSALGSPTALVASVGAGVHDFFNEPVQAFASATSPASLALGLQRGTASLLKRSLYGVFNSAAKLSGTLGQGISWLSYDQEYLRQRAAAPRPHDVTEGFTLGAQELLGGVVRGLSGIVASPVRGAVGGGVRGLLQGLGQGVLGVGVKPVVGAVDFATRTAQGIAALADEPPPERVRAPRVVSPDGLVRPYDAKSAAGQLLLRVIISTHHHKHPEAHHNDALTEHYRSHTMLPDSRALVISSVHICLLYVATQGPGGAAASLDWRLSLRRLRDVQVGERGVVVLHATAKADEDSAAAVFGRGALKTRQINTGSDELAVALRSQIENAMEEYKSGQLSKEG